MRVGKTYIKNMYFNKVLWLPNICQARAQRNDEETYTLHTHTAEVQTLCRSAYVGYSDAKKAHQMPYTHSI